MRNLYVLGSLFYNNYTKWILSSPSRRLQVIFVFNNLYIFFNISFRIYNFFPIYLFFATSYYDGSFQRRKPWKLLCFKVSKFAVTISFIFKNGNFLEIFKLPFYRILCTQNLPEIYDFITFVLNLAWEFSVKVKFYQHFFWSKFHCFHIRLSFLFHICFFLATWVTMRSGLFSFVCLFYLYFFIFIHEI